MDKKIFFKFAIDNIVDIITNSSSELFILKGSTKEVLIKVIENVYPNFREEYKEPLLVSELDDSDFSSFIDTMFGYTNSKENCHIFSGFSFDDIYEEYAYNNQWRTEFVPKEGFHEKNREAIIKDIDPNNCLWVMYSLDENPNWDMQERLMTIGERHHLG